MISVNTATLLTRAATCTLMMLITMGRIMMMIATASVRCGVAATLDSQRLLEAEIEVSFWGRSLGSPELAALQNAEFEKLWSRLRALLLDAQRLGELAAGADIEEATHRLVALIDGLSVEAVLYPARVPPGRQGALLDQLLRDFAGPPLHPARTLTE
jgi:hypothetical protein